MERSEIPPLPVDEESLALLTPTERWCVKRILSLTTELESVRSLLEATTQVLAKAQAEMLAVDHRAARGGRNPDPQPTISLPSLPAARAFPLVGLPPILDHDTMAQERARRVQAAGPPFVSRSPLARRGGMGDSL